MIQIPLESDYRHYILSRGTSREGRAMTNDLLVQRAIHVIIQALPPSKRPVLPMKLVK